jgi:chorismate mutase/prephenate dehydrogenase
MGRRLAPFFARRGFRVLVHDPAGTPPGLKAAPLSSAADADVVVVAASLERAGEALEAVLDQKPKGLVFDIASVKAPVIPALRRARKEGVAIASVHPMFGPAVRSFRGHNLIVCEAGDAAAARRARTLFAGAGLRIRTIPLAAHDPWIGRTMGLAHFLALVAGATLAELGTDLSDLDGLATTSFRRLLDLVHSIVGQDAALTRAIQTRNPEGETVVEHLAGQVETWRLLLFAEDAAPLNAKLEALRRSLAPLR